MKLLLASREIKLMHVKLGYFARKCTVVRKVFDSHMREQTILQLKGVNNCTGLKMPTVRFFNVTLLRIYR